jgi:hypothetical protein
VPSEELRAHSPDRPLRSDRFNAVLTELKGAPVALWIRPSATRAVKASLLVDAGEELSARDEACVLAELLEAAPQRPATGARAFIRRDVELGPLSRGPRQA